MDIKNKLTALTTGLYFMSESDYPFKVLDWGMKKKDEIKKAVSTLHNDAPVTLIPAGVFFEKIISNLEINDDEISKSFSIKYRDLYNFILENKFDCYVLKCGKIEVGVYIIIETETVFVLNTTSIET